MIALLVLILTVIFLIDICAYLWWWGILMTHERKGIIKSLLIRFKKSRRMICMKCGGPFDPIVPRIKRWNGAIHYSCAYPCDE